MSESVRGLYEKTGVAATYREARVVAVEPSDGMVSARETQPDRVTFVRGVGEALPIRSQAADVVLMSMAYHQLRDVDAAAGEMRRVLRAGGLTLLRTPTHETLREFAWTRFFPESLAIDLARMPSRATVEGVFTRAGFRLRDHAIVRQRIAADLAEYASRIRSRAFSSMQLMPDDVWQRRLAEFEAYCRSAPDQPVDEPVNLFVFEAPADGAPRRT